MNFVTLPVVIAGLRTYDALRTCNKQDWRKAQRRVPQYQLYITSTALLAISEVVNFIYAATERSMPLGIRVAILATRVGTVAANFWMVRSSSREIGQTKPVWPQIVILAKVLIFDPSFRVVTSSETRWQVWNAFLGVEMMARFGRSYL